MIERTITLTHDLILIPVRYDAPLGLMRIQIPGMPEWKLGVKLSVSNPDYFVFADVRNARGKTARVSFLRDPPGDLSVLETGDTIPATPAVYRERYRPAFHFSTRRGFTNDPNGLVFHDGTYHLFYQHQPFGTDIGFDLKYWGHATSTDLIHWSEEAPALFPDEFGSMFSGSAVVDWENTAGLQTGDGPCLVALYTGDGRNADDEVPFAQCLAFSNDSGATWEKLADNPVLGHIEAMNRDPRVIWHDETKRWSMALYLDDGRFGIFTSNNLRDWAKHSEIELPGSQDCPDMFQMPVDGNPDDTRWVFWAANTSYLIGDFDGEVFTPEGPVRRMQPEGTSYAAQTWTGLGPDDGRVVQIAWLLTQSPGMPFTNCMTIPRELFLRRIEGDVRLCAKPVRELESLRRNPKTRTGILVDPAVFPEFNPRDRQAPARWGEWARYPLGVIGDATDIECRFTVEGAAAVSISLRGIHVLYDAITRRLSVEGGMARMASTAGVIVPEGGDSLTLRVLSDRTSMEVYANGGAAALDLGVVPVDDDYSLVVAAKGGRVRFEEITSWDVESIW